jgi:hypothetical protein
MQKPISLVDTKRAVEAPVAQPMRPAMVTIAALGPDYPALSTERRRFATRVDARPITPQPGDPA